MKRIIMCFILLYANNVFAINSDSYVVIKEVEAWSTTIDVYLEYNQEHQCPGNLNTRFLADSSKSHHVSFLLSAYMAEITEIRTCSQKAEITVAIDTGFEACPFGGFVEASSVDRAELMSLLLSAFIQKRL